MDLAEFSNQLEQLLQEAQTAFEGAADSEALEQSRIEFLGAKNGKFKVVQKNLGAVAGPDKPAAGAKLNDVKNRINEAFEGAKGRIGQKGAFRKGDNEFDATLPGSSFRLGRVHPITQTIEELKDIMGRLGFSIADGPEIEDERHNFDALNIPKAHPARDPLENFYLATGEKLAAWESPRLLRSQTSTIQIRVMESTPPPVRIIALGRVYRPDTPDRTHYPMFHQMEGLWVDEKVTMADLKTVLRLFATNYLGDDVSIRFRPSFFPFTEPSVEVDYFWNGQWIEFGGAGMVDPNVFEAVGYDPEKVTGFAFGLGVERLCMRRHGVQDIRDLFANDVRFLRQF